MQLRSRLIAFESRNKLSVNQITFAKILKEQNQNLSISRDKDVSYPSTSLLLHRLQVSRTHLYLVELCYVRQRLLCFVNLISFFLLLFCLVLTSEIDFWDPNIRILGMFSITITNESQYQKIRILIEQVSKTKPDLR